MDADHDTAGAPDHLPDFDTLWDFGDVPATADAFRDLLPLAHDAGDPDYLVQLLSQIARTEGLQGRFDAAHELLDDAEALLPESGPIARVRVFLERGRALNSGGDSSRGRDHFLEAWALARSSGADGYAVDAAHMLGIVEPAEQAAAWNERALKLAESSADPHARRWRGSLLNNMGWSRHDAGDHAGALGLFEQALAFRVEQGGERGIRIARWCVARAWRSLGRIEDALEEQRALLAEGEAADEPVGSTHQEIAECLMALGRADEARHHFDQS